MHVKSQNEPCRNYLSNQDEWIGTGQTRSLLVKNFERGVLIAFYLPNRAILDVDYQEEILSIQELQSDILRKQSATNQTLSAYIFVVGENPEQALNAQTLAEQDTPPGTASPRIYFSDKHILQINHRPILDIKFSPNEVVYSPSPLSPVLAHPNSPLFTFGYSGSSSESDETSSDASDNEQLLLSDQEVSLELEFESPPPSPVKRRRFL